MNKAEIQKKHNGISRHLRMLLYAMFFFFISLYIVSSPPHIMLLTLFFSALHEAGHIICAKVFGRKVKVLDFSFFGLRPHLSSGSSVSCFLIYFSGVAVNLTAALISLLFLRHGYNDILFDVFVINSLLFIYNVTPVPFSDGDGIMRCALSYFLSEGVVDLICGMLNILFSFAFFLFFSFRFFMFAEGLFSFSCSVIFLLCSISGLNRG